MIKWQPEAYIPKRRGIKMNSILRSKYVNSTVIPKMICLSGQINCKQAPFLFRGIN